MPRSEATNIAHAVATDHRILRRPDPGARTETVPPWQPGDAVPLVPFYHDPAASSSPELDRDLALALMENAQPRGTGEPPELQANQARCAEFALPRLEEAVRRIPNDVAAWEARGRALRIANEPEAALEAFESGLAHAPDHEACLAGAAWMAGQLGRQDAALAHARRLVAVDPQSWEHRSLLAQSLAEHQDWPAALAESRAARDLNPFSGPVRMLLIQCLLRTGDRPQAQAEFDKLLPMTRDPEGLRRWFAAQLP
jgi:tetratricopeptide (TPR) repeat protein